MSDKKQGLGSRLWAALRGPQAPPPTAEIPADTADLKARIAALSLDLEESGRRIAAMQAEYQALGAEKDRAGATAGSGALEALFRKLAPSLANLEALAGLGRSGEPVQTGDLLDLIGDVLKELGRAGLERIGDEGASVPFDTAQHQRLSGGSARPGDPVLVRAPGYRFGGKVLLKAMVTAKEN